MKELFLDVLAILLILVFIGILGLVIDETCGLIALGFFAGARLWYIIGKKIQSSNYLKSLDDEG